MAGHARTIASFSLMTLGLVLLSAWSTHAWADSVGQIKVSRGAVHIERGGQRLPAEVGAKLQVSDVVVTGADGSVGILFGDASLLSAGPNSVLAIEKFLFDSTTNQGAFETTLSKGTLSAVSGKIAKQSPDAMKVRTPTVVLGVRGTEFVVRASGPGD
ncbi:MAG TPA: FecR domain-containing protein [Candidatus Methylomirabilis sp.]|nr:FecR domain-containing protein [Candidatus Methylomirabilis sp.]